ncbi:hypothetical protein LC612_33110 [Nostoc sp. CHAB 5834]|nr:hypothetical protein [Nostoc sp. CHAB 5834]
MRSRKHLFLDLEETVITSVFQSWADAELINQKKVRDFIGEYNPDAVHIFSFALRTELELSGFNFSVRKKLEKSLGVTLQQTPIVNQDMKSAIGNALRLSTDRIDFLDISQLIGKQQAFRLYVQNRFKGSSSGSNPPVDVVLLDDSVFQESFSWPTLRITGRIEPIQTI